ncbi:hypothetical protein HPB48_004219 [Haemaphysalis longicornis]|uniref:Uncharacterized protein n=1 Tax=Haemaphysalis longicornis TaxID=44386 RepID=A0A9J6GC83_HAELO|nr:hypothetical protein HPB48_004219 [Haemaphysalis longicornis]
MEKDHETTSSGAPRRTSFNDKLAMTLSTEMSSAAETMPSKKERTAIQPASASSGGAATSSRTQPAGQPAPALNAASTLGAGLPVPPRPTVLKPTDTVSPITSSPVSGVDVVHLEPGEILVPKGADDAKRGEEEEEVETRCGLFGVYPAFLQGYRTAKCALMVLCLVSFTRSFSMNGVMMVVLPSLERRYQLRSYESGMILSSNDVASCIAMLPVSFLATQRHKPRFIGVGIATMGLGNLVISLVHFLSPAYQLSGSGGSDLCPQVEVENACSASGTIRYF